MPDPFLSSEEYDERAHKLYDDGEYETALEMLQEGLHLYPHSVDLYVGLGYTRLARDEFAWAKHAFEKALVLDAEHEDALVGYGETLLRFGYHETALELFRRVRAGDASDDLEILLSVGRALYREGHFEEARGVFEDTIQAHPESAEAAAALAYTLHRMGDEAESVRQLLAALALDEHHHEARVYLGHLLYDQGDWKAALETFARVEPEDHWDPLALWRVIELRRAVDGVAADDPELLAWEARLEELEAESDPIEDLFAEIEGNFDEQYDLFDTTADRGIHRVRLPEGDLLAGTWTEIVRELRDRDGRSETMAEFMRRRAADTRARIGIKVPVNDPEAFILAQARAGMLSIER